jgi:thioredoxin reductase
VQEINGELGAFEVRLATGTVEARRILLCTGMVDVLPDIEGFAGLWGASIFQCPYCHGWEVQDQRFAYLAANAEALSFALFLRGWTSDVAVLTDGKFAIPEEMRTKLAEGQVRVEERPIRRLAARDDRLAHVELADGSRLERDVLFVHPQQRQVDLVRALDLALDEKGYVRVDDATRETSVPGIYAAGDLTTSVQGAALGAAAGMRAAATLNHALTIELATAGALGVG